MIRALEVIHDTGKKFSSLEIQKTPHYDAFIIGLNTDRALLYERIKKWFTLLVPLTVSLFQRADQMAQTMTDRCLGAAKRTRISAKMQLVDWVVLLLWSVLCFSLATL